MPLDSTLACGITKEPQGSPGAEGVTLRNLPSK